MNYVLGIDQSTQGTKLLLFDEDGHIAARIDRPHRQIINEEGWVSHDMNEIWRNILDGLRELLDSKNLDGTEIAAVGISNQRETTVAWGPDGRPLADAIVWQCDRAAAIAENHAAERQNIQSICGLALSPFYPAAKMEWLLANDPAIQASARDGNLHLGTVDSYLIYRMTGGRTFATDASNAGRTQLLDLRSVRWSQELLTLFGIDKKWLPEIKSSNAIFGTTDFEGILKKDVPITAAMGDSHCALFGHGCHNAGMTKATYGTGSSIMMNTGSQLVSDPALSTCIAYQIDGLTTYCLEGNINYTGAVNTWLKDDLGLFDHVSEIQELIEKANPEDKTIVIPAFTGLSAPYWNSDARAAILKISRTTGKAEIVKAANESIAMQITDVLDCMQAAYSGPIPEIRVDGGPTRNTYLMQYQTDMAGCTVCVPEHEELSAIGAAYLAGITAGLYDSNSLFAGQHYKTYLPMLQEEVRKQKRQAWKKAMNAIITLAQ